MKKWICLLTAFSFCASFTLFAVPSTQSTAPTSKAGKAVIEDETENTDVLDIPLDESEEEEQQDEKELNKLQQELLKAKKTPGSIAQAKLSSQKV